MGRPLSLSPAYDRLSFWHETAGSGWTPRPSLPGDLDVDVAVVGAGFTGLWTAYYLAEADPTLRIAVLEAEVAGYGASGRNGGWCSALFPASLPALAALSDRGGALAQHRAMRETVDEVARVAAVEGIDAHVAKGGTTGLMGVFEYAEPVTAKGFVFMDTPGYDPVSATGQVAGGANLICFTTGRGAVYGCKPAPSLKIATNTAMYERMEDDMDFNAGAILDGSMTVQEAGQKIFELMLATASGEPSKSEKHGYGQNEFVPWQVGAVM